MTPRRTDLWLDPIDADRAWRIEKAVRWLSSPAAYAEACDLPWPLHRQLHRRFRLDLAAAVAAQRVASGLRNAGWR